MSAFTFRTKPRGEQLSFLAECFRCRGELTVTNGRVDTHTCERARPITLADLRAALDK